MERGWGVCGGFGGMGVGGQTQDCCAVICRLRRFHPDVRQTVMTSGLDKKGKKQNKQKTIKSGSTINPLDLQNGARNQSLFLCNNWT